MADCCRVPTSKEPTVNLCPGSGTRGKAVELETVKALLTESALRRLNNSAHWFCSDADCDIVYFDAEGAAYMKVDLRVPIWQKEPFGRRGICYCFGENEADIRAEIESLGRSRAVERVRDHIAAGRCACEVRNPRGACCLGDVKAAVDRVMSSVQLVSSEAAASGFGRP